LIRNQSEDEAGGYEPIGAARQAHERRWSGSRIGRLTTLRDHVVYELAMGRTPEAITGRIRLDRLDGKTTLPSISHESIYRFIYSREERKQKFHRYLTRGKATRGRRKRKYPGKSLIPHRVSIHDRPAVIDGRLQFGHWEGDLMAFSKPGKPLVICVERTSRLMVASDQAGKTARTTHKTIKGLFRHMNAKTCSSITFDNGGEFALHHKLGRSTFFCDPHSPWQKGTVENSIGRLRRDLPRSTNIAAFTKRDIADIIDNYNDTPRKCLGYRTPFEAFSAALIHSGVALQM
jgi:IS30 family transposase